VIDLISFEQEDIFITNQAFSKVKYLELVCAFFMFLSVAAGVMANEMEFFQPERNS